MVGAREMHVSQTRIMLRPIGSGLPPGFYAFGIGMLLLACLAIGWIPIHEQKDVGTMLVTFVFPLELIGTIMAFLARDTLSATTASGVCGVALAALSMYGGTALALEDARRRDPLPLFRRGNARRALGGDYGEQLEELATEPGVRQQL
jgi:succinate-acetate transporter protein